MQITVESAEVGPDGRLRVRFSAKYGAGAGIWCGLQPEPGDIYQIELTVLDTIQTGRNAEFHRGHEFALSIVDDRVSMAVFVEDVEPDGVASLRLGSDCVFLVELAGPAIEPGRWLWVRLPADELELHPYDSGPIAVVER
jgi:hypothetical protein